MGLYPTESAELLLQLEVKIYLQSLVLTTTLSHPCQFLLLRTKVEPWLNEACPES